MKKSDQMWLEDSRQNGWVMPCAPRWKRLPFVRHVRSTYHGIQARRFRGFTQSLGLGIGGLPQFDRWVLYGIARGFERPLREDQP